LLSAKYPETKIQMGKHACMALRRKG